MREKKTILVVDDHPLYRQGVISMISQQTDYEVAGQTDNGQDAIAKSKKLKPDLVLMDISLPDMSGIDAVHSIRALLPETKLVVLSMHAKANYITDAFKAGACAFINKETSGEKLVECLQTVFRGGYYMDGNIAKIMVKNIVIGESDRSKFQDPGYEALTHRQQEIMRLIAEGLSTKEIAEKLYISQKTVENHRATIFSKLNIHSTMELVRFAAKYGLIDVDLWKS